jgi:4-amino-4-deoxy-L-arabinose transferase-like glycosyltransferase
MVTEDVRLGVGTAERRGLRVRALELPVVVWLGGMVLVSAMLRFALALWMPAPWIFADELRYSEFAKSFAASGSFAVRDVPGLDAGPLYPLLISPAYAAFASVPHAYVAVKAIDSILMSLAVVPTYFIARRLLPRSVSLVAAAFALAIPSLMYTSTVMTENVFYPLFLTVVLATLRAVERPTPGRQVTALAAIGLAFLARPQAVVLAPALVTAIVGLALSEGARLRPLLRRLAVFWPTWAGLAAAFVGLATWQLARGHSSGGVAVIESIWNQEHSVGAVARWFAYHIAELDLYVGVLPFAAFLVLATFVASRTDRSARIFAITSIAFVVWLVLGVAAYAAGMSRYDPHAVSHVEDRYTFYVAPLLLIALLAWVARRLPRSSRTAAAAAVVAGALPLILPLGRLITNASVADTLGLLFWSRKRGNLIEPVTNAEVKVALAAAVLAALFFLLRPPRLPRVAPLLVFLYLTAAFSAVTLRVHSASAGPATAIKTRLDWVDAAIGRDQDAVMIWSGKIDPHVVWENEFFNRSVGDVYYLQDPSWAGLPETKLVIRRSGLLVDRRGRPVRARYALTDPWVVLRGRVVARDRKSGMRLYRLDGRRIRIGIL